MVDTTPHVAGLSAALATAPVEPWQWLVIAPTVICLSFGALLLVVRQRPAWQAGLALLGLGLLVAADTALLVEVLRRGPIVMTMGRWLPPFGISFAADALGAVLALTSSVIAFVAGVFASATADDSSRRYGFFPFLLWLMAGVSGAFLTGDIFNLYVWFEVLLISSFGLLILGSEREQIDGATKYAFLNLIATTLFLVATGYLYGIFGTLNMADIARKAAGLRSTGPLTTLATLYLLAFGMKAAAFPVNFWLPASYHTPRIVVSALFAGLLTKVGVYALLRTLVMLFGLERQELAGVIAIVAAATMLLGILGALAQSDIRRIMGFVVISGIGMMLAGLALATETGLTGTVVYAVHSMISMTALYLLAGMAAERAGSFSLGSMGGLYRDYPFLAAIGLVLLLAAAGLPPFSGLWPKVLLVKAALDAGQGWLAAAILVTGLLTSIALGRVFLLAFWRNAGEPPQAAEQRRLTPPRLGYGVLLVLTAPVVAFGLYPEPLIRAAGIAAAGLIHPEAYIAAVFPGG